MVKRLFTLAVLLASMLAASAALRGDVNGDGVVDIDDLNAVINVMLHKNVDAGIEASADIDGNGIVDIDDLNVVINVMLGKDPGGTTEAQTYEVNGVTFKMIAVEGGTFTMGNTTDNYSNLATEHEFPAHEVTLDGFCIAQTEVTQELWQAVMGNNPSYFNGNQNESMGQHPDYGVNLQRPVECVSWNDCQTFIAKLNELTGATFRLPTEAEWEFAARGGTMSKGYIYAGSNNADEVAWHRDNTEPSIGSPNYGTHAVMTKAPNELGLYDMSGNVWEFCQDYYGKYSSDPQTNPTGPSYGMDRIMRGGCWMAHMSAVRVSTRSLVIPHDVRITYGLRLAL